MTKYNMIEKLQNVVSIEPSNWHKEAEYRSENKKWLRRSQAVALTVLRSLRAQGLSQKDLAERIGVSAQLINKWVKGKENFTFETIDKLETALNIELMDVVNYETHSLSRTQKVEYPKYKAHINPTYKIGKIHSEPAKVILLNSSYNSWDKRQPQNCG